MVKTDWLRLLGYVTGLVNQASALARIDPPLLAETDPSSRVTMVGHARSPEETVPDLPAVVPSGYASRPTSASLR